LCLRATLLGRRSTRRDRHDDHDPATAAAVTTHELLREPTSRLPPPLLTPFAVPGQSFNGVLPGEPTLEEARNVRETIHSGV
jgi:hypothetical protein